MKKKVLNPNTLKMCDKSLFETNSELIESPFYNDKLNRVLKFLKKHKGNILDITLGRGNLEKKILGHELNLNIYGVDISPKTISLAKKEIKGKFVVGNIFKLAFKKSFFDVVVLLDVIEHIAKEEIMKGLNKVARVIKPGGSLIISVPINENLKYLNKVGKNYNAHLREYTLKILTKELNKSGFRVAKYEYLYAFRKFYKPKSMIVKLAPFLRKPNLLIVYCNKK